MCRVLPFVAGRHTEVAMSRARPTMRPFWLFLSLAIAIDIAADLAAVNAQNTNAGPVTGVIDGVQFQEDQYYVSGWACQEGQRGSIDVHIYAGHAPGN
jgi:hypothetical protein